MFGGAAGFTCCALEAAQTVTFNCKLNRVTQSLHNGDANPSYRPVKLVFTIYQSTLDGISESVVSSPQLPFHAG